MENSELRHRKQPADQKQQLPNGHLPTEKQVKKQKYVPQLPPKQSKKYFLCFLLTVAALATRFFAINHPDQVVFDEVHFGKFASYYIRRTYYFDVHPPLGKLLLSATGTLAGYDGSYLFDKISDSYIENRVPYMVFRAIPALFGSLIVPLVFLILADSGHSLTSAFLGASMALLDTALITQSRLILLDSFLMFFDVFAVWAWVKFYQCRKESFGLEWWCWLLLTGLGISMATGVKLVGLFVVALVGLSTLQDLWRLMDIKKGLIMAEVGLHFCARAISLIFVPIVVYLALFGVHFALLYKTGPGDNFMSPQFQASLEGNRLNQESRVVFYGSNATIYHYNTAHYLHSHTHKYPLRYEDDRVSSEGQQVTGYAYSDVNSVWVFYPADGIMFQSSPEPTISPSGKLIPRALKGGDTVRIKHLFTGNYLLTHDVASPLTPTHQEVTCIGEDKVDRYNETLFTIVLDTKEGNEKIATIDTKFKICHVKTKVCIHSYKSKLPEWGFEQQEINGNKNPKDKNNLWIIDSALTEFDPIPVRSPVGNDGISFMSKFLELQAAMFKHNAALTSSHPFQSTPWAWPLLNRGISFWINNTDSQIYLLGNPLIWWAGFLSIGLHLGLMLIDVLASRRGIRLFDATSSRKLYVTGGFFVLGWALHYLPFFTMGRALFLHHYLPALIYTYLVTANVFDFALRFERTYIRMLLAFAIVAVFAVGFWLFMPFAYGFALTKEEIDMRRWLETWDFSFGTKA